MAEILRLFFTFFWILEEMEFLSGKGEKESLLPHSSLQTYKVYNIN